jgi:hypothetical protein
MQRGPRSRRRFSSHTRAIAIALTTSTSLVAMSMPAPARAESAKDVCFDAYEKAQRLRKEHKLRASRIELEACANPACPALIKSECTKWTGEVESSIPTVVVSAKNERGEDIDAVVVYVDGERVAERIDHRPITLDPGPHSVRYEYAGKTLDEHVDLVEGKKDQPLVADFAKAPPSTTAIPPPAPSDTHEPPPERHAAPMTTWIFGGIAVVGAISFAAFGLAGKSIQACSPTCSRSEVDGLRRDYLVADVSLVAALLAGGAATYFFLSSRPAATPATTTGVWLSVRPRVAGATFGAEGRF